MIVRLDYISASISLKLNTKEKFIIYPKLVFASQNSLSFN